MPGRQKFDRDYVYACRNPRQKGDPRTVKGLVNAKLLALEFESFELPPDSAIKKLKPGDFVKVARNGERFWVRVDGYVGRRWHGTVLNRLAQKDLKLGDSIYFMRKNIYDLRYKGKSRVSKGKRELLKYSGMKVWGT